MKRVRSCFGGGRLQLKLWAAIKPTAPLPQAIRFNPCLFPLTTTASIRSHLGNCRITRLYGGSPWLRCTCSLVLPPSLPLSLRLTCGSIGAMDVLCVYCFDVLASDLDKRSPIPFPAAHLAKTSPRFLTNSDAASSQDIVAIDTN